VIFILPVLFAITRAPGMPSVLRDLKMLGGGRMAVESGRDRPIELKNGSDICLDGGETRGSVGNI
jgi:hypothetical protein